jgi:hypothetical protein
MLRLLKQATKRKGNNMKILERVCFNLWMLYRSRDEIEYWLITEVKGQLHVKSLHQ